MTDGHKVEGEEKHGKRDNTFCLAFVVERRDILCFLRPLCDTESLKVTVLTGQYFYRFRI